jgi:hypothetical protein
MGHDEKPVRLEMERLRDRVNLFCATTGVRATPSASAAAIWKMFDPAVSGLHYSAGF